MKKELKPCPSCGNRRFETENDKATCYVGCGKTWTLSDELVEKFKEENAQ